MKYARSLLVTTVLAVFGLGVAAQNLHSHDRDAPARPEADREAQDDTQGEPKSHSRFGPSNFKIFDAVPDQDRMLPARNPASQYFL